MTDKELAREWLQTWFITPGVVPSNATAREKELAALLARRALDEAKFFYDALKEDGTLLSFYLAEVFSKRIADLERIVKP